MPVITPTPLSTGPGTNGTLTYTADLYGFARYIGYYQTLKLRLDYVMSATEQVITSMINNEQTAKEFSIGVYQFNTTVANNVVALTAATQGSPGDAAGDTTYEATYDLQDALKGVTSADYEATPGETILPTLVPSADGNTNFTTSVTNSSPVMQPTRRRWRKLPPPPIPPPIRKKMFSSSRMGLKMNAPPAAARG